MACSSYTGAMKWVEAIHQEAFRDFILCPWQDTMGGPAFAAFVVLGLINLPIYNRTGSALIPFVLTLVIGGVVLTQMAALSQSLVITVVLLVIGLGPVLVLRRVQGI